MVSPLDKKISASVIGGRLIPICTYTNVERFYPYFDLWRYRYVYIKDKVEFGCFSNNPKCKKIRAERRKRKAELEEKEKFEEQMTLGFPQCRCFDREFPTK